MAAITGTQQPHPDTVAAAPAPITDQALAQMFVAFTISEVDVTEEFRKVAQVGKDAFSKMGDTIQKQSEMIVALTAQVQLLTERLQQYEGLHGKEISTLTQRIDGVEKNATASIGRVTTSIANLGTQLQNVSTSAQQGIAVERSRVTQVQQSLSSLQSHVTAMDHAMGDYMTR